MKKAMKYACIFFMQHKLLSFKKHQMIKRLKMNEMN